MLVIDAFTLTGINLFNFTDDIAMYSLTTHDFIELPKINMSITQDRSNRNEIAFFHFQGDI